MAKKKNGVMDEAVELLNGLSNRIAEHVEAPAVPKKAAKTEAAATAEVGIQRLALSKMTIPIVGMSPLIVHAWSEKARKMMLDKQQKKAPKAREVRDPAADCLSSLYFIGQAAKTWADVEAHPDRFRYGFPGGGFKAAAVDAATQVDGITKVFLRGAFHVDAHMVEIIGTPRMHEAMVRVQMSVDIRFRAEFPEWRADLPIVYNRNSITPEQIVAMFELAGFSVGVGEHRPQCDGSNGRFSVASSGSKS